MTNHTQQYDPNTDNETVLAEGWGDVETSMREHSTSSFFKLDDGESALLTVVSKPCFYEKIWGPGEKPVQRIKVDVFDLASGTLKTWDMSRTVFKDQLKFHYERRKDTFDKSVFELFRQGTGKETKYRLDFVRELTAEEYAKLDALLPPNPF